MDSNDPNSLSEVESLSDSDWLDISSRASEDNDSFADSDCSDREDLASDYRPPSRRSLASYASSREGEIQGWEGIIEDALDDAPPVFAPADAGTIEPTLSLSQQSLSFRTVALSEAAVARHTALEDPEEEQRVKDALDQSMISTLSASRSNSLNASVQTSVMHSRDLRLSFPDPLTSTSPPPHSLRSSYEDITTDMASSESDKDAQVPTDVVSEDVMALTAADPGSAPTPEVARDEVCVRKEVSSNGVVDFYIVLYGTSSAIKHRVVQKVIEKLMAATHCGFSSLLQTDVPQNIRVLLGGDRPMHCIISIVDRTDTEWCGKQPGPFALSDRPSLALLFLPSLSISVPEHTLYLPVLTQDDLEDNEEPSASGDRLLDAEQQLDNILVSRSGLVSAAFSTSTVVEEEEIERASSARVARAFRPLLPWTEQWSGYHLASRNAFTIFAILSIVLGYLVNGSLPVPGLRRASPTIDIVARPAPSPIINASVPAPATSPSSMALIPSSLKDFALAAISPYAIASTSSVAVKAIPSPTASPLEDPEPSRAPSECACGCGMITWPEKFKPTTDLVLRPTPPSPSLVNPGYHKGDPLTVVAPVLTGKGKGKERAVEDESLYALSTRIAGALSEYFDINTMFTQTQYNDVQEILDALDELARAIGRQTETVWEQSKTTVEVVRENIRARHERARTRAKELREVGGRLFSSVSEQLRGRISMAKENARMIRERVHVHREESFRVKQEWSKMRRERREERRAERRAHRMQPVGL